MNNEQQPFQVGQRVVALASTSIGGGITKGDIVTVSGCVLCSCGKWMVGVAECPAPKDVSWHEGTHEYHHVGDFTFHGESRYFAPIQPMSADIRKELAEKGMDSVGDGVDVLVKEIVNN